MPELRARVERSVRYADDHALVVEVVREAGEIARRHFEAGAKSWRKPGGEPITEADLAVNTFLQARLCAARPGYGWLSEETEDDLARLDCRRVFVVDPIDGTCAFIRREPHFVVSIAVVDNGRPVVAAVFNPLLNELFEARIGAGARLNRIPIRVSQRQELEGCRMLGARNVFRHPNWPEPWPPMTIESPNAIAYRMALVACGRFDAALAFSRKCDWDLAAADLIVNEAGGRVSRHDGTPLEYNTEGASHPSLVCAGPYLHDAIIERVQMLPLR